MKIGSGIGLAPFFRTLSNLNPLTDLNEFNTKCCKLSEFLVVRLEH